MICTLSRPGADQRYKSKKNIMARGRGRGRRNKEVNEQAGASIGQPPRSYLPVMVDENEEHTHLELDALEVRSIESGVESVVLGDSPCATPPRVREPLPLGSSEIAPRPRAPMSLKRRGTEEFVVATNMLRIELPQPLVLYQYHVCVSMAVGKHKKIISKGSAQEYVGFMNHQKCFDIFQELQSQYKSTFEKMQLSYDRRRCMVSDAPIPGIPHYQTKQMKCFHVRIADRETQKEERWNVEIGATETEAIVANDLSLMCVADLLRRESEPKRMLEIITSHVLYKSWADGGSVFVSGNKAYDLRRTKKVTGGMYIAEGFLKRVKLANTGHKGAPALIMTIDKKDGAFYESVSVEEFIRTSFPSFDWKNPKSFDLERINRELKGLTICTRHTGRERTFKCKGFFPSRITVRNKQVSIQDQVMSVEDYFRNKYGDTVVLLYPNMPPLRSDNKDDAYPLEVCHIAPYQSVPLSKQPVQQMIKSGAVAPWRRQEAIRNAARDNKLLSNEHIMAYGIDVLKDTINVHGVLLPLPDLTMQYPVKLDDYGEFNIGRSGKFMVGGTATNVAIVVFPPYDQNFTVQTIQNFYNKFTKIARSLGMTIPGHPKVFLQQPQLNQLEKVFDDENIDFVLSILTKREGSPHGYLKLMENEKGVQTQNVLKATVQNIVEGKDNIMYNFLAKTNGKLGGTNHEAFFDKPTDASVKKWFEPDVMIAGMDVNHLTAQNANTNEGEPSVVGMVVNAGKGMFSLRGEHWLIPSKTENQDENTYLDEVMEELAQRFLRNRKTLPRKVLFYRDGTSEGQFAHVLQVEIPLIRKGLTDLAAKSNIAGYSPQLNVIVCIKTHNERYFLNNLKKNDMRKPKDQNIKAGTYIEGLNPGNFEFYLNSHTAIQGTAKTPRYTVLLNESGMDRNEVAMVTYTLCHGHQCVTKPISLPGPIYGAHDMAKRGKMIYNALMERCWGEEGGSLSARSLVTDQDFRMINAQIAVANQKNLKDKYFIQ